MKQATIELYSYHRSSAAFRVRIALNLKGLKYDITPVNLLTGEQRTDDYLKINPLGLVPALRINGGDVICQSTAILEFLDVEYPTTPLIPEDHSAAARVRQIVNTIACDIHPLNNLRVLGYLAENIKVSEEEKSTWYYHWIREGFKAIEELIEGEQYCIGTQYTLADAYLIPQVYNALRFNVDMAEYPRISRVYDYCVQQSPFIDAMPENQADSPAKSS